MYTQALNAFHQFNTDYAHLLDMFHGAATSYGFTQLYNKEKEVKQGGNEYFGAFAQWGQVWALMEMVNKIAIIVIQNTSRQARVNIICNAAIVLSLPVCMFLAIVKQGHYPSAADWWNQKFYFKIPAKLGVYSTQAFSFLADHLGDMLRVAMIAGALSLIALRQYYFAGAVFVSLAYEVVDQLAWMPRNISLFVERYMPILALIGMAARGLSINRLLASAMLLTTASQTINSVAQLYFDKLLRRYVKVQGPSVTEIRKPLVKHEDLTFEEINKILEASDADFEINPSHCVAPLAEFANLPSDDQFEKFLTFFDGINWTTKYSLVKSKFQDDEERFIGFLAEEFPQEQIQDKFKHFLKQQALPDILREPTFDADFVGPYITQLAAKKQQTVEEWSQDHLRKQLVTLVNVLTGKERVKGFQQDLEDAIQIIVKILPYLESLDPQQDHIELEDLLLKMAVEGGSYCARGIKRASNEIINHIMQQDVIVKGEVFDPIKDYERQIQQSLQELRLTILQGFFKQMVGDKLKEKGVPDTVQNDVHTFDIYRLALSYGFVPLTDYEKREMGLAVLLNWEMFNEPRDEMRVFYLQEMEEVRKEKGEVYFGTYILGLVHESKLTDQQKEDLLETYTECHNYEWDASETANRFYRLMLYRLGVLNYTG